MDKKQPYLQRSLMLTDKGYNDLKGAIAACTLTNFSMMLPVMVVVQVLIELFKPFTGGTVDYTRLWLLFAAGLVCAGIVFLLSRHDYKKTYIVSYLESENTRTSIAEHIRKLPMHVFNDKDLTELTTNLMGDVATTEHVMSHVVPQLFANAISITIICAMLAVYDWRMALAVFITVPLAAAIIILSRGIQLRMSVEHTAAKLAASSQVQEYLEGIKVIKATNMDGEKFAALEDALRTMKNLAIKMELGTGVFVTGAQVVLQAGIGLTVLVGTNLLMRGSIDLVPLIMYLLVVTRIYGPIQTELTLLPELLYHQVSINRMRKLMAIEPMTGETETPLAAYDIRFADVDFSYNKGDEATLSNIVCSIHAGSLTALVGPSGSGKSTISKLIARFWDVDSGKIIIGGRDISTMDPENLMGSMSFVFQDVVLFNDTIYNNIAIGNLDASEEEVRAAAKAARCDEFIDNLAEGYNTLLGENGCTLSGGERQRLSIARALLKDAPIVLLDEATASLDPENEASIQGAIGELIENKTVIVIAHRLKTVAQADKIIVLDEGRIVEEGTHESLLNRDGLYKKLFTIQQKSLGWSV